MTTCKSVLLDGSPANQPTKNMKPRLILPTLLAACAPCHAAVYVENFDTDLGTFDLTSGNTIAPNNYGYKATNNTGGTSGAGELGGAIGRYSSTATPRSYVATSSLITGAGSNTSLEISGEGYLQLGTFDGNFQVGYLNTADDSLLGINFGEPGGGSGTAFRAALRMVTEGGTATMTAPIFVPVDTAFTFALTYDGATGAFSGTIAGQNISQTSAAFAADTSTTFDAFGLQARHDGPFSPASTLATGTNTAFDALGYTVVPEPSSALMSILGLAALVARRSRRQA